MITLNPYLNFLGNTEEAFKFYQSVFGGEFTTFQRFSDTPEAGNVAEVDKDKIMHVALPIGNNVLMGTDALESMGHSLQAGNNFSLSLQVESKEEADELYGKLSAGGTIEMPLADAFWGAYFSMFTDKFGMRWMINYQYPKK